MKKYGGQSLFAETIVYREHMKSERLEEEAKANKSSD